MILVERVSQTPKLPGVYAMHGGKGSGSHIAYVGIANELRRRLEHHLERRNSSVTTGVSVISLNPDLVTRIDWWTDPEFEDRRRLEAAELIAFDVLEPVLRSRGARNLIAEGLAREEQFCQRMKSRFAGEPDGRLTLPNLQDALNRIDALEKRLLALEQSLNSR
jgi:hypothetical protein